jgi:hypothetical protein
MAQIILIYTRCREHIDNEHESESESSIGPAGASLPADPETAVQVTTKISVSQKQFIGLHSR